MEGAGISLAQGTYLRALRRRWDLFAARGASVFGGGGEDVGGRTKGAGVIGHDKAGEPGHGLTLGLSQRLRN